MAAAVIKDAGSGPGLQNLVGACSPDRVDPVLFMQASVLPQELVAAERGGS